MLSTWIEAAAKGRLGGPVRAGMWSAVVVGTHPVEADQEVWIEVVADDVSIGRIPAFWLENKGVNSLWHAPIPPQPVNARLKYRAGARNNRAEENFSSYQEVIVRPNLPDNTENATAATAGPEGLVGNRMMTVRVDERGSTYDVYFPTVGLHSDVRPAQGDLPQSRSHFRGIVAGLAAGRRLDWFSERLNWEAYQHYQGATNLLVTDLDWRHGPIRVVTTDFVVLGPDLPRTAGGIESPGQYIKRFRLTNNDDQPRHAVFGVYVQAEVNGGVGEPGLSWHDGDRTLLATNRGHGHANRKLARDATVEFALALDDRGEVFCEPTGANEAILLRPMELPAGGTVTVDLLVSGAFTGWRGDTGTFEHWLRPALAWFRAADLDTIEQATAQTWDEFIEPLPVPHFSRTLYAVNLRRSALAAALHADAKWGAIASGFDRGLHAYCWPRDAMNASGAMDRLGHPEIGRGVFEWLGRVRGKNRIYAYWFQKYSIDGWPEWETPAVDQSALIPWALERHYRRTGNLDFVSQCWPIVEQATAVCRGDSGHPGLRWYDDLSLISSSGIWDNRYGAFLYSNTCVVAGLRAAVRLAQKLDREEQARPWQALADRIWHAGILGEPWDEARGPGLIDPETGRFLESRRQSTLRSFWTDRPESLVEQSAAIDISLLSPAVPFGLLPASDPRMQNTAEAIFQNNVLRNDSNALTRWHPDPTTQDPRAAPSEAHRHDASSLASLWMSRYLIQLGRETGQANPWNRALALLDNVQVRLRPLGLALRNLGRQTDDPGLRPSPVPGIWTLHAMLIETILDFAGLDYDASECRLILDPVLPPAWPQVGLSQNFACGAVEYHLQRSARGGPYRLVVTTNLRQPVTIEIGVTCPDLPELGNWQSSNAMSPPTFDVEGNRLSWSVALPTGDTVHEWSWG